MTKQEEKIVRCANCKCMLLIDVSQARKEALSIALKEIDEMMARLRAYCSMAGYTQEEYNELVRFGIDEQIIKSRLEKAMKGEKS